MINSKLNSVFDFPRLIKKEYNDNYSKGLSLDYFENFKIKACNKQKKNSSKRRIILMSDLTENEFVVVIPYGYSPTSEVHITPFDDNRDRFDPKNKYQLSELYVILFGNFQLDEDEFNYEPHIYVVDYDLEIENLIKAIELVKKWDEKKEKRIIVTKDLRYPNFLKEKKLESFSTLIDEWLNSFVSLLKPQPFKIIYGMHNDPESSEFNSIEIDLYLEKSIDKKEFSQQLITHRDQFIENKNGNQDERNALRACLFNIMVTQRIVKRTD